MGVGKKTNYPVSLTVKAVDKATNPLHKINAEIAKLEAPKKLAAAQEKLAKLQSGNSLFGRLGAGASEFGSGLKVAGSEVLSFVGKVAGIGLAVAGAAVATGVAVYAITREWVHAGDRLQELSDRAKVSVDWFASMRYAAEQADVEQDQFNAGIDKFVKNLGDMKANGGNFLSFLDRVSPKLAEQVKGAKNVEGAFSLMTDAFKRLDDPEKLAALGAATFGKQAGPVLANFLHQGSGAIQKQQLEYLRLAGSQDAFARGASNLDNDLRDMETSFSSVRSTLGGALFPVFSKFAKAVTDFVVKNRDGLSKWADGAAASLEAWIQGGGLERLGSQLEKAGTVAGKFLTALEKIAPTLDTVGGALDRVNKVFDEGLIAKNSFLGRLITPSAETAEGRERAGMISGAQAEDYRPDPTGKSYLPSAEWNAKFGNTEFGRNFLATHDTGGASAAPEAPIPAMGQRAENVARSSAPTGATEASISVDFKNVPRGVEVSQERSTQPVNMSLGYANVSY